MPYKLFWALQQCRSLIKTFSIPQRLGQWHFRTKKNQQNKQRCGFCPFQVWVRKAFLFRHAVTLEGFQGWRYELVSKGKGNFRSYYFYLWCKTQQTGSASGICRAPAQLLDLLRVIFSSLGLCNADTSALICMSCWVCLHIFISHASRFGHPVV